MSRGFMHPENILRDISFEVIGSRSQGITWKSMKDIYGVHIRTLRKSDTYLSCVSEIINEIGLQNFERICKNESKTIIEYLQKVFGIKKCQIGEVVRKTGIKTSFKFKWDDAGSGSVNNDCVVRTIGLALDITYDESESLCFENRFFPYEREPVFQGVSDTTILKVFKKNNWDYIKVSKVSLNDLFYKFPCLKREKLVVITHGHIFYVENGTIRDTWNDGFSSIEFIFAPLERIKEIKNIINL